MAQRAAIFVFGQHGCPACSEYIPRFKRIAGPFRRQLPIGVYDIARDGRHALQLANDMRIRATPTTVVLRGNAVRSFVGALPDAQVRALLESATR